jgi:tetraacyldisaccharide 4'-kinase
MIAYKVIEKHLLNRSGLSYLLYPFSILFSIILYLRRFCYQYLFTVYKAPIFVISVGNITAGGAGKTPFTIYLAQLLKAKGIKVAVSHRGYKSNNDDKAQLISNESGLLPSADNAGDEAWLLAKRLLGIPVVIGKNRKQAIELIYQEHPNLQCIILDDSFQHLKVKHDIDFVIFNNKIGLGNGFVIPAGYLREPISTINNADYFIINKANPADVLRQDLVSIVQRDKHKIYCGSYKVENLYNFRGEAIDPIDVSGSKVILLSAIGNPQGFTESVKGFDVAEHLIYPDHYNYLDPNIRKSIINRAQLHKAKWIITTEKDYAKLRIYPEFEDSLIVLSISFVLENDDGELQHIICDKISNFQQGL